MKNLAGVIEKRQNQFTLSKLGALRYIVVYSMAIDTLLWNALIHTCTY